MAPPLEIVSYFFPAISVSADPHFDEEKDISKPDLKVSVKVDHVESNGTYQVALEIFLEPESEEKKQPYSVHLIAIGIFRVAKDFPDPVKLLRLNAAAIIFSAAREFLITVTSRGPWGAITLPTVTLYRPEDLAETEEQEKTGTRKKTPRKKKE